MASRILAFIELMRPHNCILACVAVVVGALVSGVDNIFNYALLKGCLVVFTYCSAGMVINDYYDREIDNINRPERPIPSGTVRPGEALLLAGIYYAVGTITAVTLNQISLVIAVSALILTFLYARNLKKEGFIGNSVVAVLSALTFVFGASTMLDGEGVWRTLRTPVLLALISALATIGREIIKDIQDVAGDKELGSKSLPIYIGEQKSATISLLFLISAVVLAPFPRFITQDLGNVYLVSVLPSMILFTYCGISIQMRPDHENSSKLARLTKIGIFLALFAFIIGSIF